MPSLLKSKAVSHPLFHLLLFAITFVTTTLAGAEWMHNGSFLAGDLLEWLLRNTTSATPEQIAEAVALTPALGWAEFVAGTKFSTTFLGILGIHEFGHYFTAKYYRQKVSLPYFIPLYFFGLGPSIGTMGAFIALKSKYKSLNSLFDIGYAGPVAGFVAALFVYFYAFANPPAPESILDIHPEYAELGADWQSSAYDSLPEGAGLQLGTNLLFELGERFVVPAGEQLPNPHEIIHYPLYFAVFLACFFTALNLLPIGQLDGGHILYGVVGPKWHARLSPIFLVLLLAIGSFGWLNSDLLNTDPTSFAIDCGLYLLFTGFTLQKVFPNVKVWLAVIGISFAVQLFMAFVFPGLQGFTGWLAFGFLLGRILGVHHPPAEKKEPMTKGRIAIAVLCLFIFIICFSPSPFIIS
jgi:membrane-associated protease RseP (regulator of RpoE activity)